MFNNILFGPRNLNLFDQGEVHIQSAHKNKKRTATFKNLGQMFLFVNIVPSEIL